MLQGLLLASTPCCNSNVASFFPLYFKMSKPLAKQMLQSLKDALHSYYVYSIFLLPPKTINNSIDNQRSKHLNPTDNI